MTFVSIDREKCTECGECVDACLFCFSVKDGEIIAEAGENNCILCGHCVAVCPTRAITHNKLDMDAFIELDKSVSIKTEQFVEFIRQRRAHRRYKATKILPGHFETLLEVCRYSPTGDNLLGVQILILQSRKRIEKLSGMVIDYLGQFTEKVAPKRDKIAAKEEELTVEERFFLKSYEMASALVKGNKNGLEPVFWGAPAVMIFHAHSKLGLPKDDCVIAAQTVVLTARTMGLESCYIGALEIAAQYYPPIMEELRLPPKHKVFSVLAIGYPEQRYLRTVERRPIKVRWE